MDLHNKSQYLIVGAMSGTSLDGLDLALCSFSYDSQWKWDIIDAVTVDYDQFWLNSLKNAPSLSPVKLDELDRLYASWIGRRAKLFLEDIGQEAHLLSSHGHTVFHEPSIGVTFQLGNHENLAKASNLPSVGNFRQQDVALGGQGAPLVPIGDQLLFGEYEACLNLGGFCNISWEEGGKRLAMDIGPCNMLLNMICHRLNLSMDRDGQLARQGNVIGSLLDKWNKLHFYHQIHPKSLGREWFEENFLDDIDNEEYDPIDLLATAVEHIAIQVGSALDDKGKCLCTGGGAFNNYLIERIFAYTAKRVVVPDNKVVNYKEALVFAFLGLLSVLDENNVLASVTGASRDHCSGERFQS